ncbi:MAG: gephyrin-like molybdotransferase Glp [Chthoniobacterales bacterium]
MIDEFSMRRLALEKAFPLPPVTCSLEQSLDCFAAENIIAPLESPSFDNSTFDGYAICDSDLAAGARLTLKGEQPAGVDRGLRVNKGECIRIFTGAPLPANTAAVVMQEDTRQEEGIVIFSEATNSAFGIRRKGMDVCKGQQLIAVGQRLTPPLAGLLASQGFSKISVGSKPRISILCTGNEIRRSGEERVAGEIYESNGIMLSLLFRHDAKTLPDTALVRDSLEEVREAIREKSENTDVLLICGGMSVGAYDFVPRALELEGFQIEAHRVRLKPGKPFLYGTRGTQHVFGFPGNPVSAYVTALLFARPVILRLAGAEEKALGLLEIHASVTEAISNPDDRPHYVRGNYLKGVFAPSPMQQSHALFRLSQSNALLRMAENTSLKQGEFASIFLLP